VLISEITSTIWDNSPTEKTHLRFCKLYQATFKYINHLNSLPEETIGKQAFLISKETLSFINDNYVKQKYITFWKHKLENTSKPKFYNTFKTD
jgi:hypothetical protein